MQLVFKQGCFYLKQCVEELILYTKLTISQAIYLEDEKGYTVIYE